MKVTITRSETYRKAQAITTGKNVPGSIEVEIDPASLAESTRTRIVEWFRQYPQEFTAIELRATGEIHTWSGAGGNVAEIKADVEADQVTPQIVDDHVQAIADRAAAARAEFLRPMLTLWPAYERDGVGAFLAPAKISAYAGEYGASHLDGYDIPREVSDPLCGEHRDVWDAAIAERNRRNQEVLDAAKAAHTRAKAKEEEAKAAADARKHAQLTEAVERLGDENQRARWSEGLMRPSEAVCLIEREAMAGLDGMETHASGGVGGEDSKYTEIKYLDAEEYEQAKRIKTALPEAQITYYRVSETETDDYNETTTSLRWTVAEVGLAIGEIRIVRDVVLRHWTVVDDE